MVSDELKASLELERRAAHDRDARGHQGSLLPDDARLPRRAHPRSRLDAAVRDRAAQHRERRAGRRDHARRKHGQRAVQLHALVLPRRPRARRRGRPVPEGDPAAQARQRALHRARPRQAGQDRALPGALPPPAAFRRPVRAGARREGPGDGLLHAALLRRRVQADPRPVPRAEEHRARGRARQVRARVQARPRRPAGRRAGVQAPQVPEGALRAGAAAGAADRDGGDQCTTRATSSSSITCTSSGA